MSCKRTWEHLGALLDGEVPAAVYAEIETHLSLCGPCGRLVETCRSTIHVYRREAVAPVPAAVHRRVMDRLTDHSVSKNP